MTLIQLHYIITIAETKSLNKAAGTFICISAISDERRKGTGKRTEHCAVLSQRQGRDADK